MEKNNSRSLTLNSLNINGTVISDPKEIGTFCANFYSKSKYCKDSAFSFFQSLKDVRTLSNEDKITCNKDISID